MLVINVLVRSGRFVKHSSRHSPAWLVSLAWGALQGVPARGCHSHCALTTEGRRPVIMIVLFSFLILLSLRFQFKNLALDENSFEHSDTILVNNSPPSDKFCSCEIFNRADLGGPLWGKKIVLITLSSSFSLDWSCLGLFPSLVTSVAIRNESRPKYLLYRIFREV